MARPAGLSAAFFRICGGCGARAPGILPAGWILEPVYWPAWRLPWRWRVGERALCLDCQHPELS